MNTLKNHTLVYDDECPMCDMYTRGFLLSEMLDNNGRVPYRELAGTNVPNIDWQRAKNEIALINNNNKSVVYGVDSLATVLEPNMPFLTWLLRFRIVKFLVNKSYSFISYNRKVIAPGSVFEGEKSCNPSLNYSYRWAYIIISWLITSYILQGYTETLTPIVPLSDFFREFLVCGGQIVFQAVVISIIKRDRLIHYLGNVMTVSLIGALLLLPMSWIYPLINVNWISLSYFVIVVGIMFLEHIRRVKILELSGFVSLSWVVYRLIALIFIL